jgi:predicted aminopeptidase
MLLVAALLEASCGLGYYAQAARGQFAVMRARAPVDRLIESPDTADSLREQLVRARRIRDFATTVLGLPDNAAYRSYADIGRRYVVWNVVGTPEFSAEPRQWCFPIAGCVAYRGYFSEKAAREFAARLQARGDDVFVGGVPAYSTLGRFADPLLNTVTGYGELDLAALIFHELAHQVLYVPGDSSFNEAFATVVEEEGVARYAAAHVGEQTLLEWRERRRLRVEVTGAFIRARGDLTALYERDLTPEAMREQKAARLKSLADEVLAIERRSGRASGYRGWIEAGLNNAHLAAVATYYDRVPEFEKILHQRCGGYLPCFYVEARELAKSPRRD